MLKSPCALLCVWWCLSEQRTAPSRSPLTSGDLGFLLKFCVIRVTPSVHRPVKKNNGRAPNSYQLGIGRRSKYWQAHTIYDQEKKKNKTDPCRDDFWSQCFKMVKLVCFLPTIYDQISTGVLTLLHYMFSVIIFKKLQRICKDNF